MISPYLKKQCRLLAYFLLMIGCLCGCSVQGKRTPEIFIQGYSISYRGFSLQLGENVNQWIRVLGKPSRHFNLASEIYVWDDLGIFCYYDFKTNRTETIAVAFGYKDHEFWPEKLFEGCISVDGAIIDKNTQIMDFNYNKKGQRFREGYFPSIYHYDVDNAYVRLDLNDLGKIVEFSISKHLDEK